MQFKLNPHSSKTMDDLKAEFVKDGKKREKMEFDKTHGFKTRHEIVKY